MSTRTTSRAIVAAAATLIVGCSSTSVRSVFHPTDPRYVPARGARPRVYLESNLAEVPKAGFRSVGLIEVTVPESSGTQRAIEVAADKGGELGCWILIERSAFEALGPRTSLDHGATIYLAHGGGGGGGDTHGPANSSEGRLSAEFHCMLQGDAPPAERSAATRL